MRQSTVTILLVTAFILTCSFNYSYVNRPYSTIFSSIIQSNSTNIYKFDQPKQTFSSSIVYSLDNECQLNSSNDTSSHERIKQFNHIFDKRVWGNTGSRSGPGSSLDGTYDWIRHLRSLFEYYSIGSVADIPCGDTYWQFSIRELNTLDGLYFGGDISTNVIKQNQQLYHSKHTNKIFHYWDLVHCSIPTYSYHNQTHQIKNNHFDLVIVRDALQHMHIQNGLKAVRNVVLSGTRFFALSTYPPNGKSSAGNTRSIGKNESLPAMPIGCDSKNYCQMGKIKDGDWYPNNINCPPFNFPLNKAILVEPSHVKFNIESDEMHIYEINEELKEIVKQYDKACI